LQGYTKTDTIYSIVVKILSVVIEYVPVLTGTLKASGSVIYKRESITIEYSAPYAATVEAGISEPTPLTDVDTQRVYVPTHRRKGGVVVKGHYKRYDGGKNPNAKVITFRPKHSKFEYGPEITRVITENATREGQWFLKRAVMDEIQLLPDAMEKELNNIGTIVI
jgi:hypothetical protein